MMLVIVLVQYVLGQVVLAQPLERVALVIGNSNYRTAPLPNPRYDAEQMSALLVKAGFKVDMQLDTDLNNLQAAVQKFGTAIRDPKVKFGLFYYAGHGMQQDWRNYLVPVSANIKNASEVPKQTVDVSQLLSYMGHTQGRSFLVILDACRDNPFASTYKSSAKGLSQFDAPVGSLLAYATAPGNVALDGEGKNGLYTSFLLREFAVPGTRIEDAFKRVRLSVRLASKGQQIPWESTSLEEDLFMFPTAAQTLSEAEKEKLLESEMASWQEVKTANDPEALARFIRQYPSGNASELAQARLNRILLANFEKENKDKKATAQANAAAAALEVAAREELARRRVAEAEQKRLAAQREEEQRQRLALAEAARETEQREAVARVAAEREAQAKLAAERARLAEADAKRLADLKQEKERKEAQQLALAQAEQARQAQASALAAQAELQRANQLKAEKATREKALALAAENKRIESLKQAELEQKELLRLASEKRTLEQAAQSSLLAAAPTTLEPTPYFKGYAQHDRVFRVGEVHQFSKTDLFTKRTENVTRRVTGVEIDSDRIIFDGGTYVTDAMGNALVNQLGNFSTVRQFYPAELVVGKKWTSRFKQVRPNGTAFTFEYKLKVVAKESITVPAGTFDTYRIEARGFNLELGASIERDIWVSPGVNADIAQDYRVRLRSGQMETNQREELLSFTPTQKRAGLR
jgi:uncharacterized caspase-like protein